MRIQTIEQMVAIMTEVPYCPPVVASDSRTVPGDDLCCGLRRGFAVAFVVAYTNVAVQVGLFGIVEGEGRRVSI
jgi:hypothetical protein